MKIHTECDAVETGALLTVNNQKLGVVLNWKYEGCDRILTEVSSSQAAISHVTFPCM